MTNEELKRIESLCGAAVPSENLGRMRASCEEALKAVQQWIPSGGLQRNVSFLITELQNSAEAATALPPALAEIRRLRELVKEAELIDQGHCHWCLDVRGVHSDRCPAFTPDGEVR